MVRYRLNGTGEMAVSDEVSGGNGERRPNHYEELFHRSADAILIIEGEVFVDCNQAAVDMLRCTDRNEVLSTHPSTISPPIQPDGQESFAKANAMISLAHDKGSHRFEWRHLRRDGTVIPVEVLLTSVHSGDKVRLHVVWRDISERLYLEQKLRESQKMEAIGELAGGIAHDFNNVLVTIMGHSNLIESLSSESKAIHSAREISKAGERAAKLIEQLMSFSRHRPVAMEVINLRTAVLELEPLLRRLVGPEIVVEVDAETDLLIYINPSQVDQVVLNLAANARDAMGGSGSLRIRLTSMDRFAQLSVTDTGCGMDATSLAKAFEPFFTTKSIGEGTGFGLSTVYRIARDCGGDAQIQSEIGNGTCVRVQFPLSENAAVISRAEVETSPAAETVLLIEDDTQIAELIREYLKSHYTVIIANSGTEALELVASEAKQHIDLIICDVMMPNMTGPECVAHLRKNGCHAQVLYISGYTAVALAFLDGQPVDLLRKPFTREQLAQRVRRALELSA